MGKTVIRGIETEVLHLLATASFALDVGGEGRHARAWNLNPSRVKTIGADRGDPIPRLILGRAESIPLPARSVDLIIVERTPLRTESLYELHRIISQGGKIVLRHAVPPTFDPHGFAYRHFARLPVTQNRVRRNHYCLQQTIFHLVETSSFLFVGEQAKCEKVRGVQ